MPTETQHQEQRVAALQSDLNARDQALDDAATENNERELSRRDWFDEAKRLEKEVEELRGDLASANADKEAYAQNAINLRERLDKTKADSKLLAELDDATIKQQGEKLRTLTDKLAERDALLERCLLAVVNGEDFDLPASLLDEIKALSASAETSAPTCGHPSCKSLGEPHPFCDFVRGLEPNAPAERDERAELSAKNQQLSSLLRQTLAALNPRGALAKAIKAALDKATEGASHE